jgi:hypothetical protein
VLDSGIVAWNRPTTYYLSSDEVWYSGQMEKSNVAVESVKDLQPNGKRLLEDILGQQLQEDQQVFIMVFSTGKEPDDAARQQARAGLERVFQKTAALARQQDISEEEIEAAIHEAMDQVRPRHH